MTTEVRCARLSYRHRSETVVTLSVMSRRSLDGCCKAPRLASPVPPSVPADAIQQFRAATETDSATTRGAAAALAHVMRARQMVADGG